MATLTIVKYPDSILRAKARPVDPKDPGLKKLVQDMFETMYAAEGVGLAANQVGLDMRIAVIDDSGGEDKSRQIILINPEILESSGEVEEDEGCLSFPKIRARARRASWARVQAVGLNGKPFTVEGDGLLGKALQHELDHLNGKLFIDRVGLAGKALISGKLKELKAEAKKPKARVGAR